MEEWKEYKISDVCKIRHGFAFKGAYFTNEKQPYICVTPGNFDIKGGFKLSKPKYYHGPIPNDYILNKDDLIVTMTDLSKDGDTLGYSAIIPQIRDITFLHNQRIGLVESIASNISKHFLYWVMRTPEYQKYIVNCCSGSTVKHTSPKLIGTYVFKAPDPETQEEIASLLNNLDAKIELNRRINDNLEQQAQALFKSWFVNFEPFKNGQFVDSELGKIPKGWKVGYLSEIADIIMGQSPNGSTYNENGEGIIFYQGRAEFGTRFPSIRLFTTNPTRIAPANSILISVRAPVGDINITHKECCIGRGLASAVSRTNKSAFLLYTLFSLKSDLDRFNAEGTVFGSINRKALETLKILIPTNDIISKFEAIVASMDQQILILHIESENLKILRDTLLPKLMSGERSVIHKENNDD